MTRYNSYGPGVGDVSRPPRIPIRLILALGIALFSVIAYFMKSSVNPYTGQKQRIGMSPQQEVAIGLQSAPQMAQEFGGESRDAGARATVERVGRALLAKIPDDKLEDAYQFNFHLLADHKTINAFALPGGQCFITEALFSKLENEAQLAGVLGHEIGHVLGRHSAERMAKSDLMQGLVGAAGVAGSDTGFGPNATGQIAQFIGQFTLLKYSRDHELQSDRLGVELMVASGYDPREMIGVMKILEASSGGSGRPEFSSTHPNPGHRAEVLAEIIKEKWPNGLPPGLKK